MSDDIKQIEAIFRVLWGGASGAYPRIECGRSLAVEQVLYFVMDSWGRHTLDECLAALEDLDTDNSGVPAGFPDTDTDPTTPSDGGHRGD